MPAVSNAARTLSPSSHQSWLPRTEIAPRGALSLASTAAIDSGAILVPPTTRCVT